MGSFFSSPSEKVQAPTMQTYSPTGMGQADPSALGGIANLSGYNTWGQLYPQVQGIGQAMIGDPSAMTFLAGAGPASMMGQAGALGAFGQGQNLYTMGGQVAQTAFDPQSALYGRTAQQVQDQTRAGLEARGMDMTPYGAGVEGQAMSNFNIDWQNNQLARQLQGLQGAGQAIGQGAGLQAGAPGQFLTAAGMPWTTGQQIGGQNLGTLGTMAGFGAQGAQIPQQQIQDYLSYLGWGTGDLSSINQANLGLYSGQLKQAAQESAENQAMWKGIGQLAGGVMGLPFGGAGGTVGGALANKAGGWLGSMFG
jgi:hypothetical protein